MARKAKQGFLPEMEPLRIAELDDAAETYADLRDRRMATGLKEQEAQAELMALMKKHKLKTYTLPDGRKVEVVPGEEKVKVRKPEKEKDEE